MAKSEAAQLVAGVVDWFEGAQRPLPWRDPSCTPWGILLSEVMLQQTQVARGLAIWSQWIIRWPTPNDLAAAPLADVLIAWDRLGYPRRARWLHESARIIRDVHDGQVPNTMEALRALPGIGEYTASAVLAFAFGQPTAVLDTNVRRVIERAFGGTSTPAAHITNAERDRAASLVEIGGAAWSAAAMELGALICTSRSPQCLACPIQNVCEWRGLGHPESRIETRKQARFEGSDRQARGFVMAALRLASVRQPDLAWPNAAQLERAITSLESDGLLVREKDHLRLP